MQIQINTDHNLKGSTELQNDNSKFENIVENILANFQNNITRIEIHLSDVNAGKNGFNGKRCLIEARVSGVKPIVATNNANNLLEALEGATEKLRNSLAHMMGKLNNS